MFTVRLFICTLSAERWFRWR